MAPEPVIDPAVVAKGDTVRRESVCERMRSTTIRASLLQATQAQRVAILARHADDLCLEIAAAGVLDAFDQNRPASFEDVVQIELAADRLPGGSGTNPNAMS